MFKTLEQRADELIRNSTNTTIPVEKNEVKSVLGDFLNYKYRNKPSRREKVEFAEQAISKILKKCKTSEEFYEKVEQFTRLVNDYQFSTDLNVSFSQSVKVYQPCKIKGWNSEDVIRNHEIFTEKVELAKENNRKEREYVWNALEFYQN